MDYEKAYKEALNWMRGIYPTLTGSDKEDAEHYFPELKESEDERIRKEIISALKFANDGGVYDRHIAYLEKQKEYMSDNFDDVWNAEECAEIINEGEKLSPRFKEQFKEVCHAWYDKGIELEKQKERKPILEVFGFKVGDAVRLKDGDGRKHIIKSFEEVEGIHGPNFYLVEFEDNSARDGIYPGEEYPNGYYTQMEKFEEEQKPNIELIQRSWYMEGYHDRGFNKEPKWIIKTGEGGPRYEENPKYGQHIEEKSVEWEPQPESLEALMYAIEGKWEMIKPTSYLSRRLEDLYEGLVNAYRELKNKIDASMDSTAQKKQDYSGLNDFERAIHRGFLCAGVENVPVNIIKETAQDCLAHLPVEWSEEDEETRKDIIAGLEATKQMLYKADASGQACYNRWIAWLNYLRPQSHWKPSKEQMKALWDAYKGGKEQEPLRELIEQLKKL